MIDYTTTDLLLRTRRDEREREIAAIARASSLRVPAHPHSLRTALARKLARLALRLDRETATSLVTRELRPAGRA